MNDTWANQKSWSPWNSLNKKGETGAHQLKRVMQCNAMKLFGACFHEIRRVRVLTSKVTPVKVRNFWMTWLPEELYIQANVLPSTTLGPKQRGIIYRLFTRPLALRRKIHRYDEILEHEISRNDPKFLSFLFAFAFQINSKGINAMWLALVSNGNTIQCNAYYAGRPIMVTHL